MASSVKYTDDLLRAVKKIVLSKYRKELADTTKQSSLVDFDDKFSKILMEVENLHRFVHLYMCSHSISFIQLKFLTNTEEASKPKQSSELNKSRIRIRQQHLSSTKWTMFPKRLNSTIHLHQLIVIPRIVLKKNQVFCLLKRGPSF